MCSGALTAVLRHRGMSLADLARKSGVAQETISRVAGGRRRAFSRTAAPRIYRALDGAIPLLTLLGVKDPKSS
jgi:transcriptional regulator with XRE-family HTH domain